ncbi:MAG: NAD+ synthase [Phycisphaerales bacterium]|nr:MAG: NAD+ synthase [Phycisphaerales bacterium]
MRIALAQLNPIVGDVAGNCRLVCEAIEQARRGAADLLVTPEMVLLGYPPRDLLFRQGVVEAAEAAVATVAEYAAGAAPQMTVIVGHPRRCRDNVRTIRNSASVLRGGRVEAVYDKRLLPGYDIFDEDRYFDPGSGLCVIEIASRKVGVLICEDLWRAGDVVTERQYPANPASELAAAGCDLLAALNATPFIQGKFQRHLDLVREATARLGLPVAVVNQVGGNDDLIFDGRSLLMLPDGSIPLALPGWESAVKTVSLEEAEAGLLANEKPSVIPQCELFNALVLGVRDYCHKTGHRQALIGLSGGIDSSLTAVIAAAALGPANVLGVTMPSRFSSQGSVDDSKALAENLGLGRCDEVGIDAAHQGMRRMLTPVLRDRLAGLTDENIQARLRGVILMACSNATGALVLATGNKSELAVGYATLYGDMSGALAVLGDVVKTKVYDLARWINANHAACGFAGPPIPESTLEKPPSAELRPDQTDQDSLPPYDVLDQIIDRYVEHEESVDHIVSTTGSSRETVESFTRLIDQSQYKREQSALVLKVTQRAFGRGRPFPIVVRDSFR